LSLPPGCFPQTQTLGDEIKALKALPERKPGMISVPAGRTIAQEWDDAERARLRGMLAEFEVRVVLHPARIARASPSLEWRSAWTC